MACLLFALTTQSLQTFAGCLGLEAER